MPSTPSGRRHISPCRDDEALTSRQSEQRFFDAGQDLAFPGRFRPDHAARLQLAVDTPDCAPDRSEFQRRNVQSLHLGHGNEVTLSHSSLPPHDHLVLNSHSISRKIALRILDFFDSLPFLFDDFSSLFKNRPTSFRYLLPERDQDI